MALNAFVFDFVSLIICVFVLLVVTVVVVIIYCLLRKIPDEFLYVSRPSLLVLYIRGLYLALWRKQGNLNFQETQNLIQSESKGGAKSQRIKFVALDCRLGLL